MKDVHIWGQMVYCLLYSVHSTCVSSHRRGHINEAEAISTEMYLVLS